MNATLRGALIILLIMAAIGAVILYVVFNLIGD